MIRPEKMSLMEVVSLERDRETVLSALYSEEVEIEEKHSVDDLPQMDRFNIGDYVSRAEDLLFKIKEMKDIIGTEDFSAKMEHFRFNYIDLISAEIILAHDKLTEISRALATEKKALEVMEDVIGFWSWISSLGISPGHLTGSKNLDIFFGKISVSKWKEAPRMADDRLIGSFLYSVSNEKNGQAYLICACLKHISQTVLDILEKSGFSSLPVSVKDGLNVDADVDSTREKIASLESSISSMKTELSRIIGHAPSIEEYVRAVKDTGKTLSTSRCSYMTFWALSKESTRLRKKIMETTDGCALVGVTSAEELIRSGKFAPEGVPTVFVKSRIFEPFRMIVSVYSRPVYRMVDPTIASALSFLLMFGMMFADLGHGLVLLACGIFFLCFRGVSLLRNIGVLIAASGISSAVFGVLFGSFFGREDILHPLWFAPFNNTQLFLALGIFVGVGMISLGIIFSILQNLWRRDYGEVFFSEWGALTLGFYWLCLYFVYNSFSGKGPALSFPLLVSIILFPMAVVLIGDIARSMKHGGEGAAEIAFKPVDVVLGLLSNTVSFVRVAAFGLTHIALMSAVYIVAEMSRTSQASMWSAIVGGNLFVIMIEGLIVTIQCLRLQFYEFYSKFFSPGGRRFEPFGVHEN